MGKEMPLYILLDKCRCSVLINKIGFKEGEIVDVELDFRKAHIFKKGDWHRRG